MTRNQWIILFTGIGILGGMVATLPDWTAAKSPAFIGLALGSIGTQIAGLLSKGPQA